MLKAKVNSIYNNKKNIDLDENNESLNIFEEKKPNIICSINPTTSYNYINRRLTTTKPLKWVITFKQRRSNANLYKLKKKQWGWILIWSYLKNSKTRVNFYHCSNCLCFRCFFILFFFICTLVIVTGISVCTFYPRHLQYIYI